MCATPVASSRNAAPMRPRPPRSRRFSSRTPTTPASCAPSGRCTPRAPSPRPPSSARWKPRAPPSAAGPSPAPPKAVSQRRASTIASSSSARKTLPPSCVVASLRPPNASLSPTAGAGSSRSHKMPRTSLTRTSRSCSGMPSNPPSPPTPSADSPSPRRLPLANSPTSPHVV